MVSEAIIIPKKEYEQLKKDSEELDLAKRRIRAMIRYANSSEMTTEEFRKLEKIARGEKFNG